MDAAERDTQVRNFVKEVWNGRNYEAAADLYGENYVNHFGTGPSARVEPIRHYHAAFPDLRLDVEELIVAGDTVVIRLAFRGTDTGGYVGRPPTGRAVEEWVVDIMHFEGDRVVNEWIGADKLGLFIQLGVLDDPWPSQVEEPATERLEVQRAIAAGPEEIFRVLTDPHGHVAIDSSGMLMDATGDSVTAVGDTFVVHMDREALNDYPLGLYDVTVEIVKFDPDREIAWKVEGQLNLGHVYGYTLKPIDGGTLVTSYYDWSSVDQSWKDAAIFPVIPEAALRATLGILARTAAPGRARPAA